MKVGKDDRLASFVASFCKGRLPLAQDALRNYNNDYYLRLGEKWISLTVYSLTKWYGKENLASTLPRKRERYLTRKIEKYVATLRVPSTASESFLGPRSPFPIEVENLIFSYVGDDRDGAILQTVMDAVLLPEKEIKTIVFQRYEMMASYPMFAYDLYMKHLLKCAHRFVLYEMRKSLRRERCAKIGNRDTCDGNGNGNRRQLSYAETIETSLLYLRVEWIREGHVLNEEMQLFDEHQICDIFCDDYIKHIPTFLSAHSNNLTNLDMHYIRSILHTAQPNSIM